MYDDTTKFRLAELRQKSLNGTASPQELREGLLLLRNGRLTATYRSGAPKKSQDRTAKPKPSISGMLGELGAL